METTLLATCNVYCDNCAVYKKRKCLGCERESKMAEIKEKVFCDIYSCAKNKNWLHAVSVLVIRMKNMMRAFSLKASSNGLEIN